MADGVQFVLDRMASTFRQMEEFEVFSSAEVKSVVKKRTDFEYVLKRRQLTVGDFYKYLEYEVNLEKFLCLRCDKDFAGGVKIGGKAKTRQDGLRNLKASAIRHICTIFERGIRRFPNEFDLLMDYVNFLKEHKSNSILNEVFGRALALHPKHEDLWLQAAVHELDENNNVHAARVLLQTALRANKKSKKLWSRYFDLELWNATKIFQRQEILKDKKADASKIADVNKIGAVSDDEDDQLGLIAAPGVVFKHAIQAMNDAELACEMHRSSMQVSEPLAKSLEEQLKERFGAQPIVWRHFLDLVSNMEGAAASKEVYEEEGGSKRRRTGADRASSACLSQCMAANALLREFLDSEAAALGLTAKEEVLGAVATLLRQLLLSILSIIEKRGEAMETDKSTALLKSVSEVAELAETVATYDAPDALHALPMRARFVTVQYFSGAIGEVLSAGVAKGTGKISKKAGKKDKSAGKKGSPEMVQAHASIRTFLEWVQQSCERVDGAVGDGVSLGSAGSPQTLRSAARAWLHVARIAGEEMGMILDFGDNDEDDEEGSDEDEDRGDDRAGKNVSRYVDVGSLSKSLGECLCTGSRVIASLEEAPAVFKALRDAAIATESQFGQAMLSAIGCPLCPAGVRGKLCLDYVTWVVALPRQEAPDTVVKSAHEVIRQRVLNVPTLVAQAGMEVYYRGMAGLLLELCEQELSSKEGVQNPYQQKANDNLGCVQTARTILDAGITHDSTDRALWDARERVECDYARNTLKANQVRLRRDHALE